MELNVSPQDIATLEARTEGWIAGLQLAAISMQQLKHQNEITQFVDNFSSSHRYIMDYLTDEVLQQRPEGTRDFLLQTSILSRLSAPLCQAVTGMANSQEILESLDGANLFLISLDDERVWYRYHHLFDDLLQKRLDLHKHEFVSGLHLRAAEWYKENGWISEALDHFLKAEDHPGAADLIEENARALLERSELATFMSWVDVLPETEVLCRPRLCVYHAWALRLSGSPFDVVESRINDAQAAIKTYVKFQKNQTSNEDSAVLKDQIEQFQGHIFALQSFQHLYKEDIHSVLDLTQQAQAINLEENFVLASISFARGWALRFSGDLESAYQAFADTAKYSLESGNIYLAVAGTCRAAYGRVLGGELGRAYDEFQKSVDLATRQDGTHYPVVGYAFVYMGGIQYEWGKLEPAKRFLREGIELCGKVGYIMDQVVGLVTLAQVHKAVGDSDAIKETMDKANNLAQKMKSYIYVRRWVENTQVRLWKVQEKWHEMANWIQTCGMTVDDALDYNRDLEHIILARALVYSGINQPTGTHLQDAVPLLSRLLDKARSAKWMGKAIEILILQTLTHQALGSDREAMTALNLALSMAEPVGYIRLFVDEGPPMEELLLQVASDYDENRYVNKLLDAFKSPVELGQPPSTVARSPSPLAEPLSDREREVLELMASGKTNQEIAADLIIAVTTAKKHVSNIIGKLGVTNRTQAVARVRDLNLM